MWLAVCNLPTCGLDSVLPSVISTAAVCLYVVYSTSIVARRQSLYKSASSSSVQLSTQSMNLLNELMTSVIFHVVELDDSHSNIPTDH